MRIIQKRRFNKKCENERIGNLTIKDKNCGYYEENRSNFTRGNTTYDYNSAAKKNYIKGTFMSFDESGFYKIISFDNPEKFYLDIDKLINEKWVDEDTLSLLVNYNIYSINHDMFLFFRILWENQGFYFKRYPDFGLIDINPTGDIYSTISIVISFIVIGYRVYELKEDQSELSSRKKNDSLDEYF